ncbi:MAG: hypothetical protein LIP23_00940 [Planctomycetes bacterium]|nr:hypothetical protein [Planctomycetota bacterium]
MSSINPAGYSPVAACRQQLQTPVAPIAANGKANPKPAAQTDTYTKSGGNGDKPIIDPEQYGAYRDGECWVFPPSYLTKIAGGPAVTVSGTTVSASVTTDGLDADFKAALSNQAMSFTDLEKSIHKLLGFTVESYSSQLNMHGAIDAKTALEDGSFFTTSFAAFAAAGSITYKYTFDQNFHGQYDKNSQLTVDYFHNSLRAMMESAVISQAKDGTIDYTLKNACSHLPV